MTIFFRLVGLALPCQLGGCLGCAWLMTKAGTAGPYLDACAATTGLVFAYGAGAGGCFEACACLTFAAFDMVGFGP